MTAAFMHEQAPSDLDGPQAPKASDRGDLPTSLARGALIYLWPPFEQPRASRPTLARVKTTRQHAIEGVDLRDGQECWYEIGTTGATGTPLGWTWEEAAPPQSPCPNAGITWLDRAAMDLDERRRFLFGELGATVTVHAINGPPVTGVITAVMMEEGNPVWIELGGAGNDPRGRISHRIKFEHIVTIQQITRA